MKHRTLTKKYRRLMNLFSEQIAWHQDLLCSLTRQHKDLTRRFVLVCGMLQKLVSPLTAAKAIHGLRQDTLVGIHPAFAMQLLEVANMKDVSKYFPAEREVCPRCSFSAFFVEGETRKCAVCEARSQASNARHNETELKLIVADLVAAHEGRKNSWRPSEIKRIQKHFPNDPKQTQLDQS